MNMLLEKEPVAERFKIFIEEFILENKLNNHPEGPFRVEGPTSDPRGHLWFLQIENKKSAVWCNINLPFELLDDCREETIELIKLSPTFSDHFLNEPARHGNGIKTITLHWGRFDKKGEGIYAINVRTSLSYLSGSVPQQFSYTLK